MVELRIDEVDNEQLGVEDGTCSVVAFAPSARRWATHDETSAVISVAIVFVVSDSVPVAQLWATLGTIL